MATGILQWLCGAALVAPLLAQEVVAPTPFKDGERIVFFGDSLTHGGLYLYELQLLYATRLPERNIAFENAGIAGAAVPSSLARLDTDVLARKPTRVLLAFGMNDVNRWLYATADQPDEELKRNRIGGIDVFGLKLKEAITRIRAAGAAAEVLTPTPYDQYNRNLGGENLRSCNDGLADLSRTSRRIAAETGSPLIELHAPLTSFLLANPGFVWSHDRVHPSGAGYLIMMRTIATAQGLTGPVAAVTVDRPGRRVVATVNCAVDGLAADGEGVRFTYRAGSLPFPTDGDYAAVERAMPWKEFNRESLQVQGLAAGDWRVLIGDTPVGTFTAAALAAGVDLAGLDTPQQRQARAIRAAVLRRASLDIPLRTRELVVGNLRNAKVDPEDRAAVDAFMEAELAKGGGGHAYNMQCFGIFRDLRDRLPAALKEVEEAQAAIRALQKIPPVTIRIIR